MTARAKAGLLLGIVLGAVALVGAACGGGSSTNNVQSQSSATPLTTCKPASPPIFGTPIIPAGKQLYESPDLGYTIVYPDDWHVSPSQANYQNVFGDTFFSPDTAGDIQPNITVTCETIPVGGDTNAYADYRRAVLQQLLNASPDSAATVTVDGKSAFFWHYKITSNKTPTPTVVDKIEVLFADSRGGWIISLVAPEGHLGDYKTVLDDALASFHEH